MSSQRFVNLAAHLNEMEIIVCLLITDVRKLVIIPLQDFHCRWKNRREEVTAGFHSLAVNKSLSIDGFCHGLIIEVLAVNIGESGICTEHEKVTDSALFRAQLAFADLKKFFLCQGMTFLVLATLELT